MKPKLYYSREEMLRINVQTLLERGVTVEEIADVAFRQQSKYNNNVELKMCLESVEKILSLRDILSFATRSRN